MFKIRKLKMLHFWMIFLIILIQPLVRQMKPLLFGDWSQGVVVEHYRADEIPGMESSGYVKYSIIEVQDENHNCRVCGPENLKLQMGRQLPVIFYSGKKDRILIATFSGIFLQGRTSMVIIVLVIWIAIFFTMKQFQDDPKLRQRKTRNKTYR